MEGKMGKDWKRTEERRIPFIDEEEEDEGIEEEKEYSI